MTLMTLTALYDARAEADRAAEQLVATSASPLGTWPSWPRKRPLQEAEPRRSELARAPASSGS